MGGQGMMELLVLAAAGAAATDGHLCDCLPGLAGAMPSCVIHAQSQSHQIGADWWDRLGYGTPSGRLFLQTRLCGHTVAIAAAVSLAVSSALSPRL